MKYIKPPYYHWENALPQSSINRILDHINKTECEFFQGKVYKPFLEPDNAFLQPEERRCKIYLFNMENCSHIIEREICLEFIRLGREANEIYNFDLDFSNVQVQFAIYTESENDFFDWHSDDHILKNDWIRKLTIVVVLKECEEGGMFEFENFEIDKNGNSELEYKGKVGNGIAFPSYTFHKVNPITKGTRITLVGWFHGKPWA